LPGSSAEEERRWSFWRSDVCGFNGLEGVGSIGVCAGDDVDVDVDVDEIVDSVMVFLLGC